MKYTHKNKHALENRLYILGLVFFIAFTIIAFILKLILPEDFRLRICPFFRATGYYCPGCCGTRAVLYLLEGQIVKSFIYHPLVIYIASIYTVFMVSHTIERATSYYYIKKERCPIQGLKFRPWYLYGAVIVIFINVTVKNILIHAGIWHS